MLCHHPPWSVSQPVSCCSGSRASWAIPTMPETWVPPSLSFPSSFPLSPSLSCHSWVTTGTLLLMEGYKESAHTHTHTHSLQMHTLTVTHTYTHTCSYTLNTHEHIHRAHIHNHIHSHMHIYTHVYTCTLTRTHKGLPNSLISGQVRSKNPLFLAP